MDAAEAFLLFDPAADDRLGLVGREATETGPCRREHDERAERQEQPEAARRFCFSHPGSLAGASCACPTGAPLPKFVLRFGTSSHELRKQRGSSKNHTFVSLSI